jgi:hypothetical protein
MRNEDWIAPNRRPMTPVATLGWVMLLLAVVTAFALLVLREVRAEQQPVQQVEEALWRA